MEELENIIKLNELYDLYKGLLTEKQREYYEAFYFENLSLSEIAEDNDVSRAAVHSQVKIVKDELVRLEETLHLSKLINNLKELNDSKVDKIIEEYEEN